VKRWFQERPSPFPHEQDALDHVKALMPQAEPFRAWATFSFTAASGRVNECDLLILVPRGLFLVELKGHPGRLVNNGGTWNFHGPDRIRTISNPLHLTDLKSKELKSQLLWAASKFSPGLQIPRISPAVFLSAPDLRCELDAVQRIDVFGRDDSASGLPRIWQDFLGLPAQRDSEAARRERFRLCACRLPHPCSSGGMSVLVDDAAESVSPAYVQEGDLPGFERFGHCAQGCRLVHGLVGPVCVVVLLELVQGSAQVVLVPDQGPVQEFVAAGLHPALHDGVHARHPDTGEHDLDAGIGQDLVEQHWVLRVPVPDQVSDGGSGVLQVHDQIPGSLGNPVRGGVRGGAEDPDAPGGMLDDREDVLALTGQGDRLNEVAGQQGVGLGTQEVGPAGGTAVRGGVDALRLEDLPHGRGGDLDAES
jgi:hypothetical protein